MITVFLVKRVLDRGPERKESNETVLGLVIIIILISYIIFILLIMENHPSRNQEQNSTDRDLRFGEICDNCF